MGMTRQESDLAVFGNKVRQFLLAMKSAKPGNAFCCFGSLIVNTVQDVTILNICLVSV